MSDSLRSDGGGGTAPHLLRPAAAGVGPHEVRMGAESRHVDMYTDDLGPGTAVYDEWAIEDDATGASADAKYENLGRSAAMVAAGRGFRTPAGRPSSNELWRFRVRGCQDCWAALFFFALLTAVMLWGASELYHFSLTPDMVATLTANAGLDGEAGLAPAPTDANAGLDLQRPVVSEGRSKTPKAVEKARAPAGDAELTIGTLLRGALPLRGVLWLLTWSGIAVAAAWVGLAAFRWAPRALIVAQCWIEAGVFAALGVMGCLRGNLFEGILFAVLAVLPLVWLYLVQDRIPFAVCMLKTASRLIERHSMLVAVALACGAMLVVAVLGSLCLALPALLRAAAEVPSATDPPYLLLLLFTLFWTEQVLVNVAHVTVSGVVATWYFAGEAYMPGFPIRASLKRATTASLGSICFGSLFVAIVRFLRFLAQAARGSSDDGVGEFVGCVCECFLRLLEALLRYFNVYAFVHVAIYGCSYVDAAKRTWALTQQCFFAGVFNDCLVHQAVDVMNLMIAVALGVVGGVTSMSLPLGLAVGLISFFVNAIVFQVVQSTVTAVFVCFAEVPQGLEVSFPELYDEIMMLDERMPGATVHQHARSYGTL